MNNQPKVSMMITGVMLKTYMIVARTWAIANTTAHQAKAITKNITVSFAAFNIAKA